MSRPASRRTSAVLMLSAAFSFRFLMFTPQQRCNQFRPFLSRNPISAGVSLMTSLTSLHLNSCTNESILAFEINAYLLNYWYRYAADFFSFVEHGVGKAKHGPCRMATRLSD